MADFVFPPGGEGVEVVAPNGVKYYWDVDNNRWGIRATASSVTEIVKVANSAPDGVEGDLWLNTADPNNEYLSVRVSGFWVQTAPSLSYHEALVDRVALLESTTEIINEYKCALSSSIGGMAPLPGDFKTSSTSPRYASSVRLNPHDLYGNPIPIIHEDDGFEMLHEENGHSHRFKINQVISTDDSDLTLKVSFIGGDEDSFKQADHYLFRFHTPNTDMDVLAHLDRDQTFTGANTFDGDVVFTGNVTMPDGDGDGDGEGAPTLDGDNTFTGNNFFAKTTFKSDDDTHRLYMKDVSNSTNLTIFPTGNISSKGNINFSPQNSSTFAQRYGSRVRVDTPVGWTSSDGDFGFYVDISRANTQYNRFVVGGRSNREKAFEVYDDGAGVVRSYGKLQADGKLSAKAELQVDGTSHFLNDVQVDGTSQFLDDIQLVGNLGGSTNSVVEDTVYICYAVNLTQSGSFTKWREVGCSTPQVGHVFKATTSSQLIGTDRVKTYTGDVDLMVSGDVSVGGILMGDNIEGHQFYFSGGGEINGPISFTDSVTINYELDLQSADVKGEFSMSGTMNVTGRIDLSNAAVSNNTPLPKRYFGKVLKEFAGDYKSIYINDDTNGTSDPPIDIKAGSTAKNLIQLKNNTNNVRWGVNVHNSYMFGGTSSAPWNPTSNHHFTVKKYVDDQIANTLTSSSGPTGMWFKYGGDSNSISQGEFILNNNRIIFDSYNDDALLWMGGVTSEGSEAAIWSHLSIYRQTGSIYILEYMYQLEKMRVGTAINNRRTLNFTKIYRKYGTGLPEVGTRYLISCGGFF